MNNNILYNLQNTRIAHKNEEKLQQKYCLPTVNSTTLWDINVVL